MTAVLIAVAAAGIGAALSALVVSRRAGRAVARAQSTADRVLENASDALIACGPDGVTITAWNPAAERLFGWKAVEVLGSRLPTVGDDDRSRERGELLDRVRAGEQVSVVTSRVRRDGTAIDVRINYSAIQDPNGDFAGWMGAVTDVTEELAVTRERSSRAELVERLNRVVADINAELDLTVVLERIVAHASDISNANGAGFAIVEDESVRVAAGSGTMREWVGYSFAPGEGTFLDAFAESRQLVIEDYQSQANRVRVMADIEAAVLTPVRVRDEHIGALAVFFSTPGRHVTESQLEALRLLAGHAGTAVANARAYGAMARGRALAQEVLDRLVDGVAVLDDAGKITRWNRAAAQLTGLLAGEVLGRQFPWRTGTRAAPTEHRLRDDVWMETVMAPLPEAGGSMVVMRDISRHMALQETKSLFLAMASHELRTPLTVIAGYARRLQDRADAMPPEEHAASIDAIVRKASVLERTIDQLMAGSLAELGRLEVETQPMDIAPLIESSTGFLAGTTATHTCVVEIEPGLPSVLADVHAVESVLAQLLENAVKYSPQGGRVVVRAVAGRDDVEVSITDEGVGLRPGDEDRVFDRFARGTSGVRGTGLGLFIVQRLVEAQGGRVWARRHDVPGTRPGATFAFSLPRD
jgi:PAS domain S-box-containing protein